MSFAIRYSPDSIADIKDLDRPTLKRIKTSIESRLGVSPFDYGKPLRHSAKGLWSLRVGDWRVIYQVNQEEVWILKIAHRREVYKLI